MFVTIISFVIILSVLVLVHEAGHFTVAKLLKIKVEEFGFGLPPRVFGFKFGETLYSLNWLPIGGFVKLYGEDEAGSGSVSLKKHEVSKKDINRAFFSRPKWQKALVITAGVIMNFILAVVLISYLFAAVGVATPTKRILIAEIANGSPALAAGLKSGDAIEAVFGKKLTTTEEMISLSKANEGKELTIQIKTSKGIEKQVKLTPRLKYPKDQGPLGIAIEPEYVNKKYSWIEAPFVGTKEALKETAMIAGGLWTLLVQLVTKGMVPSDVAGPVGIAQLTGKVVDIGLPAVLSFVSLLSLNLAIINILPIPALDGGRLLFIVIEAVTRRKVNPEIEGYAHTIGMAVLLALIALITLHDILRVLSGQPLLPK